MSIREKVIRVLDGLSSENYEDLQSTLLTAGLLLQKHMSLRLGDQGSIEFCSKYLGEEYVSFDINEDEFNLIISALISLLDASPGIAASAAANLKWSGHLSVIPSLASSIKRWVAVPGMFGPASQAAAAIGHIVALGNPDSALSVEERRILQDAYAALEIAALSTNDPSGATSDWARAALDAISLVMSKGGNS